MECAPQNLGLYINEGKLKYLKYPNTFCQGRTPTSAEVHKWLAKPTEHFSRRFKAKPYGELLAHYVTKDHSGELRLEFCEIYHEKGRSRKDKAQ